MSDLSSFLRTEARARRLNDDGICDLLDEAAEAIERQNTERLKLDRRIHNQRVALRDNWEIVEMRRKWLGSDTARKMYISLSKRYRELRQSVAGLRTP